MSAFKKDIEPLVPKGPDGVVRSLHVLSHYAVIPIIYAIGLIHADEFTWNPLALIEKIFVA